VRTRFTILGVLAVVASLVTFGSAQAQTDEPVPVQAEQPAVEEPATQPAEQPAAPAEEPNPVAEPGDPSAYEATPYMSGPYPWYSRIQSAKRLANSRRGRIGFAVMNEKGRIVGGRKLNEGFRSASVVKVIMMTCYLNHPSVRGRALTQRDRDILAPMIRRSANEPANYIYTRYGPGCITNAARQLGMKGFTTQSVWGRSRITPAGTVRMFWRVDKVIVSRHRRYAKALLGSIVPGQRWGLPYSKPRYWTIRFKGGWARGSRGGRIVNQGAMFTRDGRRFCVAVLTDGSPTHRYGTGTIKYIGARLLRSYGAYPDQRTV
jgi:hypothetical protein